MWKLFKLQTIRVFQLFSYPSVSRLKFSSVNQQGLNVGKIYQTPRGYFQWKNVPFLCCMPSHSSCLYFIQTSLCACAILIRVVCVGVDEKLWEGKCAFSNCCNFPIYEANNFHIVIPFPATLLLKIFFYFIATSGNVVNGYFETNILSFESHTNFYLNNRLLKISL